jgi:hypothetical protein
VYCFSVVSREEEGWFAEEGGDVDSLVVVDLFEGDNKEGEDNEAVEGNSLVSVSLLFVVESEEGAKTDDFGRTSDGDF